MRLIDADKLKKALGITSKDCSKCDWGSYESCGRGKEFEDICIAIDNIVTADATIVRHGRWIPYNSKYGHNEKVYLCNQCNNNVGFKKMNFCPNCGTKMDGKDNNNETD